MEEEQTPPPAPVLDSRYQPRCQHQHRHTQVEQMYNARKMRPRQRLPRPTALSPMVETIQDAGLRSSLLEAAALSVVVMEASGGGSGGKGVGDGGGASQIERDGNRS